MAVKEFNEADIDAGKRDLGCHPDPIDSRNPLRE
jgi:hypothetical protein